MHHLLLSSLHQPQPQDLDATLAIPWSDLLTPLSQTIRVQPSCAVQDRREPEHELGFLQIVNVLRGALP